jgi:hypothetical protein
MKKVEQAEKVNTQKTQETQQQIVKSTNNISEKRKLQINSISKISDV